MSPKPFKIVGYLILAAVVGLIGYIVIGFSFFAYNTKTLVIGCEQEFCVEQTKVHVESLIDGKYSFYLGTMVPYDPMIKPSEYKWSNRANSIDEMIATDHWTIVYNEKKNWRKYVHLKFRNEVLYQIDIENYGPFYIDF